MKKMNTDTAQKIVSSISSLNNIPHLNAGGCGVVAYYLAEQLIAAGYDARIVELHHAGCDIFDVLFGECEPVNITENNQNMHDAAINHKSPSECNVKGDDHYGAMCDGFYFDSGSFSECRDGVINLNDKFNAVGEIPLSDFEYVTIENRRNMWNTEYNPRYNDKIKDIIYAGLSFLTNEK